MKSEIIVLIFALVQLSTLAQKFQSDSASIPLFTIPVNENPGCLTQQQRETALREFRNAIASKISNTITVPCKGEDWTRVAYLNMSDPTQSCPPAWRDRSADGFRVCGRPAGSNYQCHGTIYSTSGRIYNRVCGRVIGYQFGHTDAFHFSGTIIQPYADGISITHGNPRSHIWTLAAGLSENDESGSGCPCDRGPSAPSFVGDNYYCESGYNGTGNLSGLLTSDPLWDGAGCESEGSCCSTAPWFTVDLVNSTSDDIEIRICSNADDTEDSPIHLLELYIQ